MSRMLEDRRAALISMAVGVAALLLAGSARAAESVYLKLQINGQDIEGESPITSLDREGAIVCDSFSYGVTLPLDSATSRLSGSRQHGPVKITKRIDKSTPLLLKALTRNEVVNRAEFRFYRPLPSGKEEQFYTVTLQDARITAIEQHSEDAIAGGKAAGPALEDVTFTVQDITWTYEIGGVTHQDSVKLAQ